LGDVSDQSKNREIYEIFLERFEDIIKNTDNDICIDNTNLDEKSIFNLLDICNKYKEEIYLIPNFFLDSFDWELCRDRVKKDRTDRSRTDTVEVNGVPLHKQMCDRFTHLFKKMAQNEDAWADFVTGKYPCVKTVRFFYV
jgi:predicted kinase